MTGLRASWLGVSTVLLDDGETAMLTDGFFSRPGALRLLLGRVRPDEARIRAALARAGIHRRPSRHDRRAAADRRTGPPVPHRRMLLRPRAARRRAVGRTGARRVVPVHRDDFTRPLDRRLRPIPRPLDDVPAALACLRRRADADGVEFRLPVLWQRDALG